MDEVSTYSYINCKTWKKCQKYFHLSNFSWLLSTYCDILENNMENEKKNIPKFRPNSSLKLMNQVREVLRYHHYAYRTEQTYCQWILRYIHHYGGNTHPNLLGAQDIERFLSRLATVGKVSASTQRQALNALVFFSIEMSLTYLWCVKSPRFAANASSGHRLCLYRRKFSNYWQRLPASTPSWLNCFMVVGCA